MRKPRSNSSKGSPTAAPKSRSVSLRADAALELARRHPEFARACSERLDPETRDEFVRALATRRPPLRPLKKAGPERYRPTDFSLQLQRFAKLSGN